MAKVIKEFRGCPDGQRRVRRYMPGEELSGELARVAVANGWARDESTGQTRRTTAHDGAPKKRTYTRRKKKDGDE